MFFPLRDVNPTRGTAWVTWALLVANIAVFAFQFLGPVDASHLVASLGFIPARFGADSGLVASADLAPIPTLFTSMFLHGDVLHLGGNALYLWIFGNNVEDVLGSLRFLFLYLVAGLGGHLLHFASGPGSMMPTIGASGAISGVLAAYLVRFPGARVLSLLFLGLFVRTAMVPASVVIVAWFLLQLLSGFVSLGEVADSGGVAWFEHVGGFVVGLIVFLLLGGRTRR